LLLVIELNAIVGLVEIRASGALQLTISSQSNTQLVAGTGLQTEFAFSFVAASASAISVELIDANGNITTLQPSQYTLVINPTVPNQLWGVGGTITYPIVGAPIPVGSYLLIQRVLPLTQVVSIQNQGNFYAQVTEQAVDILEMQIQQVSQRTGQWRGVWASGVTYNFGDVVQDGINGNYTNNYYMCNTPNVSGVWSTDFANGYWTIVIDIQSLNAQIGTYLPLTGGTISGNLTVTGRTTVQSPTVSTDAATKGYVDTAIAGAALTGEVRMWTSTTPPTGWILPYGQLLSRASYPTLWAFAQTSGNMDAWAVFSWQRYNYFPRA
jgi:hypothetical protein